MSDSKKIIQKRILDAAVDIQQEAADGIIFQHGIFCQVALPRRKQEGRVFERSFKNASILIEAGKLWNGKKWDEHPLPYGPKPRLSLLHINSEAVRTQSPYIEIGRSASEFLRHIGLCDGSGSVYNLFKRQMMALAASRVSIGFTSGNRAVTVDAKPISKFEAWIANDDKQPALWPGFLQLSQEYFESLLDHAVPLDPRAITALSHSSLALDIYSFLGSRLCRLEKSVKIPFPLLQEQFGQDYKGKNAAKDFQREFEKELRAAHAVYPDAKIEKVTGGFVFFPSKPPIPKAIIQGSKAATEKPEPLPPPDPTPNLTERTTSQFRELYPRLDVYACQADFDAWLSGKGQPKDYQKAFLGFARKWAKGKG